MASEGRCVMAGPRRGRRRTGRGTGLRLRRRRGLGPLCLFLVLWLTAPTLVGQAAGAADQPQPPRQVKELADFDRCAHLALRQSPYFTKSSLEIEVRRLDEKDSKTDLFPNFTLRTRFYPVTPQQQVGADRHYALELACDHYNPLEAYFSIKVRRLITRIAFLAHHKAIAEGLLRLGQGFLEMEALERLARLQEEMLVLAQKGWAFQQQLLRIGEISSLEVKISQQEMEVVQNEQERLRLARSRAHEAVKAFLGLKTGQDLAFDLRQVRPQVLGPFDPEAATLGEAKARSLDLKIQALRRELQSWHITLAKMKLLPNFNLGMSTPDPLGNIDSRGIFFSIGLSWPIPVLDGGKRFRDITRQKTVLKQYESEGELKGIDVEETWQAARDRLRNTLAALKLARSQEELARLRERQMEILYQSGRENFAAWLKARKGVLEVQVQSIQKSLEHDLAQLQLCHLSGRMLYRYVDERLEQQ